METTDFDQELESLQNEENRLNFLLGQAQNEDETRSLERQLEELHQEQDRLCARRANA